MSYNERNKLHQQIANTIQYLKVCDRLIAEADRYLKADNEEDSIMWVDEECIILPQGKRRIPREHLASKTLPLLREYQSESRDCLEDLRTDLAILGNSPSRGSASPPVSNHDDYPDGIWYQDHPDNADLWEEDE